MQHSAYSFFRHPSIPFLLLLLSLFFVQCESAPPKQEEKQSIVDSLPMPTDYVNDFEHLFSVAQIKELTDSIKAIDKRFDIEIGIATLDSSMIGRHDFKQFTLALANKWGVGSMNKQNGLLIAISKSRREMRIENGRGGHVYFSDADLKTIIDSSFIPSFKKEDYFMGTKNGLLDIRKRLYSFVH